MSTLYSIEESLERATVTVLESAAALDDVRIVSADEATKTPCRRSPSAPRSSRR
jgi:hypothetical protein